MVAGRLASFINTWKVLTKDLWVLDTIKGYQMPFKDMPLQAQIYLQKPGSQENRKFCWGVQWTTGMVEYWNGEMEF